jgi:hypothetical protein
MLLVFLVAYTFGCVQVLRLSNQALIRAGVAASALAIAGNVAGILLGAVTRALVAVPILALGILAAVYAFKAVDELPRDSEEEQRAKKAGLALAGLALAEATLILLATFVWIFTNTH